MKKITVALLFGGLLAAHADFVYQSGSAFLTTADLDGDGRSDLVLVDGPSATVRVGYQLSAGSLTWAPLRSLGLDEVTDIACGTVQNLGYESLVATAPFLNRVNVYELLTAGSQPFPVAAYGNGTGPQAVMAIDIGGTGNTAHDDLVTVTTLNGLSPFRLERIRASGGTAFSSIGQVTVGSAWQHLNSVEYGPGLDGLAFIDAYSVGFLRLYDFSTGGTAHKGSVSLSGMTQPGYVSFPHASGDAHFVLWESGSSTIRTTTLVGLGGGFSFSSLVSYNLSAQVDSIFLVQGGGANRLAVVYSDGTSELFDYDGSGAPVSLQTFRPPLGESFGGFLPIDGNDFMMLSSTGAPEAPLTANQMHFSGGSFSSVGSQSLSSAIAGNGRANVMTFAGEPFVDSTPQRLQLLRAGDWSTSVALGANVTAQYETDGGSQQGLGNPVAVPLGATAPGASYSLDNQLHSAISVHSFDAARGEEVVLISIAPEPATFGTSVEVSFSTTPASAVYYRTDGSSAWSLYSAPFTLFADTDVQYYAVSGSKYSIIRSAPYRFSDTPSDLDSDGDGIPDYVEIANGLDPFESGLDGDGDGYSDLDELLSGSDPTTNSISIPANSNRFERTAVYDQILIPRPYDGVYNTSTTSREGTQFRLFSASGAQYAYAQTTNLLPGISVPRPVLFEAVPLSLEPSFVAVVSDINFETYRDPVNKHHGVELVGLYLQPTSSVTTVDYTYQGGTLATEANNWLATALDVYTNQVRTVQVDDLSLTNTLAGMLIERKLANLLQERGVITTDWASLFKGRTADGTMAGLSSADLQSLEQKGPGNEAAYHLRTLVTFLQSEATSQAGLLALTQDLYDIRSYYARFPSNAGKYPLPVDVLREFLYSGTMHSNYLAHAQISPAEVTAAFTAATQMLSQVSSRPIGNFMMEVQADSFGADCPVLYTGGNVAKSLYDAAGRPFRFPETFTLQPGAQVSASAFTDPDWNLCPGTDPLEVISLSLTAVPTASGTDADGNLLPDDYEEMFLVGSGGSATSDLDGDGRSDLQEYLDGTDPNSAASFGSTIADLSPPVIWVQAGSLSIDWPAAYADAFVFTVEYTEDLPGTPFATDQELPEDVLDAVLNLSAEHSFYRVQMRLR